MSTTESDNLETTEVTTWIKRNGRWVYPLVMFLIGALGGNADRIWNYVPESPKTIELEERINAIESVNEKQTEAIEHLKDLYLANEEPWHESSSSVDEGTNELEGAVILDHRE